MQRKNEKKVINNQPVIFSQKHQKQSNGKKYFKIGDIKHGR